MGEQSELPSVIVLKTGGGDISSLKDLSTFESNLRESKEYYPSHTIVSVHSAFGGITKLLTKLYYLFRNGDEQRKSSLCEFKDYLESFYGNFSEEFKSIFVDLELSNLEVTLKSLLPIGKEKKQESQKDLDSIKWYGEFLSLRILSEYLESVSISHLHIKAKNNVVTNKVHGQALIDLDATRKNFFPYLKSHKGSILLTEGFIGSYVNGSIRVPTTLGSEGSDYTAAALASMFKAELVIYYKNVDGIYQICDEKNCEGGIILATHLGVYPVLDYEGATKIIEKGAKILHPQAIKIAKEHNIPFYVKNFYNPHVRGTLIGDKAILRNIVFPKRFGITEISLSE